MNKKNRFLAKYGSSEHIDKFIDDNPWEVAENPNLKEKHITHLIDSGNNTVSTRKDLKSYHIDKLLARENSSSGSIARNIARNSPKLESKQIDHLLKINGNDEMKNEFISRHPDLQPHHIDHLIKEGGMFTKMRLVEHPNLQPHQLDILSKNPNPSVYLAANRMKVLING